MGSAAASLSAWWALGFLMRAFEHGGQARLPGFLEERKEGENGDWVARLERDDFSSKRQAAPYFLPAARDGAKPASALWPRDFGCWTACLLLGTSGNVSTWCSTNWSPAVPFRAMRACSDGSTWADVVERGAFARSLRTRGAAGIRMLFQHDPNQPIGTVERAQGGRARPVRARQADGGREPRAGGAEPDARAARLTGCRSAFGRSRHEPTASPACAASWRPTSGRFRW